MTLTLTTATARALDLAAVVPFSQQAWQRAHDPTTRDGTLCAGLTLYWLLARTGGTSPMHRLARPTAALVDRVRRLQSTSAYPSFPAGHVPTAADRRLLARKYGTRSWDEVRDEVDRRHQGDIVLHDLSLLLRWESARVVRVEHPTDAIEPPTPVPPRTATLGLLRYRERDEPRGHRITWYVDEHGRHDFFDPNLGEVTCDSERVFRSWLDAFLARTSYRRTQPDDGPFLRLYQLERVAPR